MIQCLISNNVQQQRASELEVRNDGKARSIVFFF